MKHILLTLTLCLAFMGQAQALTSINAQVITRVSSGDDAIKSPKISQVLLTDLYSKNAFEGKHFKIVQGTQNQAISTKHQDKELVIRAATTYYHLTKAKQFFTQLSPFVMNGLPQITVRIDITTKFNPVSHFVTSMSESAMEYNNALTIPPGDSISQDDINIESWGYEIWFRPAKTVNIDDLGNFKSDDREFNQALRTLRDKNRQVALQRILSLSLSGQLTSSNTSFLDSSATEVLAATAIIESFYLLKRPLTRMLQRKNYHLDTAMIPEIIYSEFVHLALVHINPEMRIDRSTPINEGFADIFSSMIGNTPTLAMKIKKYNTFNGKDARKERDYDVIYETNFYANIDFAFGLLWASMNTLNEVESGLGKKVIFDAASHLNFDVNIRDGLIQALLDSTQSLSKNKLVTQMKLLELFRTRGL